MLTVMIGKDYKKKLGMQILREKNFTELKQCFRKMKQYLCSLVFF